MHKLARIFILCFFCVLPLSRVWGVTPDTLSIRLSQPKTPTNQTVLPLVFVALDIDNNPITVRCLKQGPGEGAYTQFGSDIALTAGGNTGTCDINASLLPANGVYNFKSTASNGSQTVESDVISLNFSSGNPGDPTEYSKDHISSCQYKIHFRTADDGGKTTSVEIYRSEGTSFTADSGTRITTIAVGSNESRDYIDSVACDKTHYYAIRAFDIGGNGSGIVGDSVVNVTYTTTSTTTITTVTGGGGVAPAPAVEVLEGAGLPAEGVEGTTLGETTGQPEVVNLPGEEGQVKGTKTAKISPTVLGVAGGILGVSACIIWYVIRKKNKKVLPEKFE